MSDYKQELKEEIEKMETQRFLDKKSQVNDFVKIDEVLEIIN